MKLKNIFRKNKDLDKLKDSLEETNFLLKSLFKNFTDFQNAVEDHLKIEKERISAGSVMFGSGVRQDVFYYKYNKMKKSKTKKVKKLTQEEELNEVNDANKLMLEVMQKQMGNNDNWSKK